MKRNLKGIIIFGIALAIMILSVFGASAEINWQPAPEFIKIGGSMEMTGPTALQGATEMAQ